MNPPCAGNAHECLMSGRAGKDRSMRREISMAAFRTPRIRRRDVSGAAHEAPRALRFVLTTVSGLKTMSAKRQAPSAKRQAPSAKRQAPSAKRQAPSASLWPRRPSPLARPAGRAAASLPILSAAARGDVTVSAGSLRTGPVAAPAARPFAHHPPGPVHRRFAAGRARSERPASIPDRRAFGRNPSGPATIIGENP